MDTKKVNNLVIISDLHCGCQFGLCPPCGMTLDGGGTYEPSQLQKETWKVWEIFWNKWIPEVAHNEPFALLINGDMIDGKHHNAVTQISQNLSDQSKLACSVLQPIIDKVAGASLIVSGDHHLLDLGEYEGIRILSAAEFVAGFA